jgi:hypothetical protein
MVPGDMPNMPVQFPPTSKNSPSTLKLFENPAHLGNILAYYLDKTTLLYKYISQKQTNVMITTMSPFLVGGGSGGPPTENLEILDGRRCNLGIYLRKMKLLIGLKNAGFLG